MIIHGSCLINWPFLILTGPRIHLTQSISTANQANCRDSTDVNLAERCVCSAKSPRDRNDRAPKIQGCPFINKRMSSLFFAHARFNSRVCQASTGKGTGLFIQLVVGGFDKDKSIRDCCGKKDCCSQIQLESGSGSELFETAKLSMQYL